MMVSRSRAERRPTEPAAPAAAASSVNKRRRVSPSSRSAAGAASARAESASAVAVPDDGTAAEVAVPPSALPLRPATRRECESLLRFFRAAGVAVDFDSVKFDPDPASGGWRMVAPRALPRGVVLGTVPKAACLSVRTTAIAKELEADGLTGGLGLTTAVMVERALGAASAWEGYFASLPAAAPLPVFWPECDVSALAGTELDGAPAGELDALAEDYRAHVVPFVRRLVRRQRGSGSGGHDNAVALGAAGSAATASDSGHSASVERGGVRGRVVLSAEAARTQCDFAAFARAASLVSSRAFHVDQWHGDAMVPFADAFNHRCAVIQLSDGLAIEGHGDSSDDDDDEDEDGVGNGGENSGDGESDDGDGESDSGASSEAGESGDHGVGAPASADITGMPISMSVRDELERAPLHPTHPLNIAICNVEGAGAGDGAAGAGVPALEIVLMHPVDEGDEIWNTYGELSTGALLMKYGFATAVGSNPHAIVNVAADLALAAVHACCGDAALGAAQRLLEHPGLFDDDGLFEIGVGSRDPPASLVFFAHCVAGGATKAFRKSLAKDAASLARSADPDGMLACEKTRRCLAAILLARLAQYGGGASRRRGGGGGGGFDAAAASDELSRDERALARAQSSGRNHRREAALRLRVEEQRIALGVLEPLLE